MMRACRKIDKKALENLITRAKMHSSAASYVAFLDPMEGLFVSILIEMEKELNKLKEKVKKLEKLDDI